MRQMHFVNARRALMLGRHGEEAARHGCGVDARQLVGEPDRCRDRRSGLSRARAGRESSPSGSGWRAVILLAVGRPRLRTFTRRQWLPIVLLAVVFAAMNVSLYSAVARVGLGLAVTLEFLGPLVGRAGRRVRARRERGAPWAARCSPRSGSSCSPGRSPRPTSSASASGSPRRCAGRATSCSTARSGSACRASRARRWRGRLSALVYVPIGIGALIAHPPTGDRADLRRGRRSAVVGGADGRRPARSAPGARALVRDLHEREPAAGRRRRRRRPR